MPIASLHERGSSPRRHCSIRSQRLAPSIGLLHMETVYAGLFARHVQPLIKETAERMATNHHDGRWHFFQASNGGCYMAPASRRIFRVAFNDDSESLLSSKAFGLAATVHALALLRYSGPPGFPETCTAQHGLLCQCARRHPEWGVIRRVTY